MIGQARWGIVVATCVLVACTGTSDQSTDTTFNLAPICQQLAVDIVDEAQAFVDEFNEASLSDFPEGELPGLEQLREEIDTARTDALARGCGDFGFEDTIALEARSIAGRGPVGRPLAASLRGFDPDLVPATTVELGPDSDIAGTVYELGTGSVVKLAPGEYELDESIVIDRKLTLTGAGPESTRIRSSSVESALLVIGEGDLELFELSIEHVGDAPATVVVAAGLGLSVDTVSLTGGVADAETEEDGNGLALIGSAGFIEVIDSTFSGNERIGLAVFGTAQASVSGGDASDNGLCGICVFDESTLSLERVSVMENVIGVGASGMATVEMTDAVVSDNGEVGVLVEAEASAEIVSGVFSGNPAAIEISGSAHATADDAAIEGGDFGIVLREEATGSFRNNQISLVPVGIQVGDQAAPILRSNTITSTETAAMLFGGTASGIVSENTLTEFGQVGIQVSGSAAPLISSNTIEGPGPIAVVYIEEAGGRLSQNRMAALDAGMQIGGEASPTVENNVFVDLEGYSIGVFEGATATITGNECSPGVPGIIIAAGADPSLSDNDCSVARGG